MYLNQLAVMKHFLGDSNVHPGLEITGPLLMDNEQVSSALEPHWGFFLGIYTSTEGISEPQDIFEIK